MSSKSKSTRRFKRRSQTKSFAPGSLRAELGGRRVRMSIQGVPFYFGSNGSGSYGLFAEDSNVTSSAPSAAYFLDPFSIGGRFAVMSSMFQKYRILGGTIRWTPVVTYTVAGTGVSQGPAIAIGWHPDLQQVPADFADAMRFGAREIQLGVPASCKIGRSGWLYTTTTSSSPTASDLRMSCFGGFYLFQDGSFSAITGNTSLGDFVFDLDVEYQGAQDGAVIGSTTYLDQYTASLASRSKYQRDNLKSLNTILRTSHRAVFPDEEKVPVVASNVVGNASSSTTDGRRNEAVPKEYKPWVESVIPTEPSGTKVVIPLQYVAVASNAVTMGTDKVPVANGPPTGWFR